MRYKLLGQSGLRVSELCLGTMTFGEDWGWGADRDTSRQIWDEFAKAGGNFVDTANAYTNGTSEKFVGEFIASERDRWVVATKYSFPDQMRDKNHPNAGGNSRKNMMRSVEGSLKRLNTDHIDLLYIHAWDFSTPVEELMRGLDDLIRAGKVLYVAVSDTPAWIVSRANLYAELRGLTPFIGLQIEYSLTERTPERDLIPMAKSLGLTVLPWSPLAGGVLSGKYAHGEGEKETSRGRQINDRQLQIAKVLGEVADKAGCTSSQMALAWLRVQDTIPIFGARKLDQFHDNLECVNVIPSPEALQKLDEASRIELGFPHDFLQGQVGAMLYAGNKDAIDYHPPRY